MSEDWAPRTRLVHSGTRRSQYGETSEAIFLTQGFVYPSAEVAEARFVESGPDEFIYARYGNPTVRMFEERIAALEGAEDAFATASGMAAVHGALFSALKTGDHVVAAKALFGSCLYIVETLLPRFGVEVSFVDGTDLDQWRAAIRPDTRLVFLESISNPTLEVIDIAAVAAAQRLAEAVSDHPALAQVLYPGLDAHPQAALARRQMETGGTVLSLDLAGGKAAAFRFLNALRIVQISNNLGDAKSLVTHPATTTHQRLTPEQRQALGIGDGLVRLSLGLEDPADLIADVRQALDAA